ncbi:Ribosome maturation factor RimP [bacterium HR35]|nr:Ribosome maturation factor RimP [bacterium HR35]
MALAEKIKELTQETIEDLGYKIKKIEIGREGSKRTVTIYITKDEGYISINDCVIVSRAVDPILEKADLIKEKWILIVSSPGEDEKES